MEGKAPLNKRWGSMEALNQAEWRAVEPLALPVNPPAAAEEVAAGPTAEPSQPQETTAGPSTEKAYDTVEKRREVDVASLTSSDSGSGTRTKEMIEEEEARIRALQAQLKVIEDVRLQRAIEQRKKIYKRAVTLRAELIEALEHVLVVDEDILAKYGHRNDLPFTRAHKERMTQNLANLMAMASQTRRLSCVKVDCATQTPATNRPTRVDRVEETNAYFDQRRLNQKLAKRNLPRFTEPGPQCPICGYRGIDSLDHCPNFDTHGMDLRYNERYKKQ